MNCFEGFVPLIYLFESQNNKRRTTSVKLMRDLLREWSSVTYPALLFLSLLYVQGLCRELQKNFNKYKCVIVFP